MKASEAELIRRLKKENGQYRKENRQYRKESTRYEKRIAELDGKLDLERKLWSSPESGDRFSETREAHFVHKREAPDDVIADGAKLHAVSSPDCDQFGLVCAQFIRGAKRRRDRPLFSEDGSDDPGNRCKLPYRHAVLMALMRKRGATIREHLAAFFGIDQSTVCRYLQFADTALAKILPTAAMVAERIRDARTTAQLEEIVPGRTIMFDGTHVPVQRPSDSEKRKKAYSGRKKNHRVNTTIVAGINGLVLDVSRSAPRSTHDMTLMRDDPPNLGRLTERMLDPGCPGRHRVTVYADLGYLGLDREYPGALTRQPAKRGRGSELTKTQKARNKRINRRRVAVEHTIGRIKQYRRMTGPCEGTAEEFNRELMVVTGLVNFRLLWDRRRQRLKLGF